MVELEKPDLLRLHNLSEDGEKEVMHERQVRFEYHNELRKHALFLQVMKALQDCWMPGLDSKEPEEVEGSKQYKLLEDPWTATGRVLDNGVKITSVSAEAVVAKCMLGLNRCQLNLYGRVTLGRGKNDQRTLFVFRQTNVSFSETLTIKLTGAYTSGGVCVHTQMEGGI